MKDSHLYKRMSNPSAVKVYLQMIRTYEMDTVHDLYNNLTKEASDHPRYPVIKETYDERVNKENIKE